MFKKHIIVILFTTFFLQGAALAANKTARIIPAEQNLKVMPFYFNGTPKQSALLLEQRLLKEAVSGWVYDYSIDISTDRFMSKLLVFKRIKKEV